MLSFQECVRISETPSFKRHGFRRIANNTKLLKNDEDTFSVRFHQTDIIQIKRNFDYSGTWETSEAYILNTGGYRTVTTKDRMNRFSPARLYTEDRIWYAQTNLNGTVPYREGDVFDTDGNIVWNIFNEGLDLEERTDYVTEQKKIIRKVKLFATDYMEELRKGNVPPPSGGDCWFCYMKFSEKPDSDHILAHIEEQYFVPSMLVRAVENFGASPVCKDIISILMHRKPEDQLEFAIKISREFPGQQIKKMLVRHMLRQVGISS